LTIYAKGIFELLSFTINLFNFIHFNRFAKVAISVSEPIVPFRETIIEPPTTDMVNELIENKNSNSAHDEKKLVKGTDHGLIVQTTSNRRCIIKLRAKPLPNSVTEILENSTKLLKILKENDNSKTRILPEILESEIAQLKNTLTREFLKEGWDGDTVNQIWSFGPKRCGPNILINRIPGYKKGCIWPKVVEDTNDISECLLSSFNNPFVNGFQLATLAGPLCEEPMSGVAFIVEDWTIQDDDLAQSISSLAGPVMSSMKDACRKAFQEKHQRLKVAMYSCSIQVNSEMLGKLFFEHLR
jgi:ribosome assembly protein 1